ncbi:MAG: Tn7-like transposition protein [Firmicutes bacterium]|nr:Tn7-like transposition protein [Bacillota bacterium]
MARYRTSWTEDKIARYVKEGRGSGEGNAYKPWLTVQDVPSMGRVTRLPGWKTNRLHHLLSDNETRYFYLANFADNVIDIREQYPLPREDTMEIAERLNIRHPVDLMTKVNIPLTTDFLLTIRQDDKTIYIARTIKPKKELEKKRVIEKFDIEQQYWKSKEINWGIVTDEDIPKVVAENIQWIHSAYWLEGLPDFSEQDLADMLNVICDRLSNSKDNVASFCSEMDEEFRVINGTFLFLFKHLLAKKIVRTNWDIPITPRDSISRFEFMGQSIYEAKERKAIC